MEPIYINKYIFIISSKSADSNVDIFSFVYNLFLIHLKHRFSPKLLSAFLKALNSKIASSSHHAHQINWTVSILLNLSLISLIIHLLIPAFDIIIGY